MNTDKKNVNITNAPRKPKRTWDFVISNKVKRNLANDFSNYKTQNKFVARSLFTTISGSCESILNTPNNKKIKLQ